jgi:tRNA 5-methylaminomethyl-2-thiouridine biosynthesis bifunctional protein
VLQLARDEARLQRMRAVVERLAVPPELLRFVDAGEAGALAGWPVAAGGWWFAGSAWVQPPSLCAANLAAHPGRIRTRFGRRVGRLEPADGRWRAVDEAGRTIAAAPVAILAAGAAIGRFPAAAMLPVTPARGQVSLLPAAAGSAPRVVVCRGGYVSPAIDGLRAAGATFAVDDDDEGLRLADHRDNLATLEAMLPGYTATLDAATLDTTPLAGRVGFRPASPDRLPMVGALPLAAALPQPLPLARIARQPGLYAVSGFGARGLVWAALMAELLASRLEGEPLPLERDLVDAVDPARWLLRRAGRPRGED